MPLDNTEVFQDPKFPRFRFRLQPIRTAAFNFATDRSWRSPDGASRRELDTRTFFGWLMRFACLEVMEGVVWTDEPPEPLEWIQVMTRSLPLLNQDWFDRIPPELVVSVGRHVREQSELSGEEKKSSVSPASGSDPRKIPSTDPSDPVLAASPKNG